MPAPKSPYCSDYMIYQFFEIVSKTFPRVTCSVHPNVISGIGILLIPWMWYFLYSKQVGPLFWVSTLRCILDCYDGFVARTCNQQTALGEVLDHASDIIIYGLGVGTWLYQAGYSSVVIGLGSVFIMAISWFGIYRDPYGVITDNSMLMYWGSLLLWMKTVVCVSNGLN